MADEEVQAAPAGTEVSVEVEKDAKPPRDTDAELASKTEIPEDEIGKYALEAQNRIKGLRGAYQEQKRRAEQWARDASTASNLAEQLYRENQQLKHNVFRSESALIEQAIGRADSELQQAKIKHRQAMVAQDPDLVAAATEDLARSVAEADRLKLLRTTSPPPEQQQLAQPAQAQQAEPPSPRTQAWLAQNPWFYTDSEMREYALNQHRHLVIDGITDQSNPDLYWRTIEDKLQQKFPQKFTTRSTEPRARPVAATGTTRTANGGASPSSANGKQVIKLNESQVKLAHRLGIPLEQYAKEWIEEEKKAGRLQ